MLDDPGQARRLSAVISRLRKNLGENVTQAMLAKEAGLDQSRVSRIEKGEVSAAADVEKAFDALVKLGSADALAYREFAKREWVHIDPPSFWNPQRPVLETTEATLTSIDDFLKDENRPWPLRRAIEGYRATLLRGATYLGSLTHSVAFIGKIGVGKSTALAFLFDLLVPPSSTSKPIERPVLETGAGGTTICEVHIRRGPEYGLVVQPMSDKELRDLVADFSAAKWVAARSEDKALRDVAKVSTETDRAIRNMTGLTRKPRREGAKTVMHDPVQNLIHGSETQEEFRTRVLEMM